MVAKAQYGKDYTLKQEIDDVYEDVEVAWWPEERSLDSCAELERWQKAFP